MSRRGAQNAYYRKKNLPTITAFCEDLGLQWKFLAGDWHIRIEGKFDVYPTRKRYHFLPTGERGSFKDYDDLGQIFVECMQANEKNNL